MNQAEFDAFVKETILSTADLLVVNGDPLADVSLLATPETNLRLIMKAGRIYRNSLQA